MTTDAADPPESRFLKFQYPEFKDILKHSLTFMAGTLVVSATLAPRVLPTPATVGLSLLFATVLISLLAAIVFAARALYLLYMAGERAAGPVVYDAPQSFIDLAKLAYRAASIAERLYLLGLFLLIVLVVAGQWQSIGSKRGAECTSSEGGNACPNARGKRHGCAHLEVVDRQQKLAPRQGDI